MRDRTDKPPTQKWPLSGAVICALVGLVSACTPHSPGLYFDSLLFEDPSLTGGRHLITGLPYTRAQEDSLLQLQKERILSLTPEPDARAIGALEDFETVFRRGDGSSSLEITLKFRTEDVTTEKTWTLEEVLSENDPVAFEATSNLDGEVAALSATCPDPDCLSQVIEVTLATPEGTLQPLALIQRRSLAYFHWRAAPGPLEVFSRNLHGIKNGFINTKEVPFSFSRVQVELKKDLCFEGELLATNDLTAPMAWSCSDNHPAWTVELVGNTNSGDWLFAIGGGSATLSYLEVSFHPDRLPGHRPLPPQGARSDNPTYLGSLKLDPNNRVTSVWERAPLVYDYQGKIQKQVTEWMEGTFRNRIQSYLKNLIPRTPEMAPALDEQGVPHELTLVTLWETGYFLSPDYPVQIGASGEVGPWQFMRATAQAPLVGLKVFGVETTGGKRVANPCDERGHLKKSTEGAAKYWRWLLNHYREDPHLAVLAYNWGTGNVNTALNKCHSQSGSSQSCKSEEERVQQAHSAGYNFWVIEGFNMAPRVRLDYVIKFLAAYSIARDHEKHRLEVPSLPNPGGSQKNLERWALNCPQ